MTYTAIRTTTTEASCSHILGGDGACVACGTSFTGDTDWSRLCIGGWAVATWMQAEPDDDDWHAIVDTDVDALVAQW